MNQNNQYSVYLAGELFDIKHLAGNALLAEAIYRSSEGKFSIVLPQDIELASMEAKNIRDQDFRALFNCDAAIFQFDGSDLDSGTVAEFMAAKFADIPSVLLRTDFRRGGDRNERPWNLMCSYYPRTEYVCLDAMSIYSQKRGSSASSILAVEAAVDEIAKIAVAKIEDALAIPALEGPENASSRSWLETSIGMGQ